MKKSPPQVIHKSQQIQLEKHQIGVIIDLARPLDPQFERALLLLEDRQRQFKKLQPESVGTAT